MAKGVRLPLDAQVQQNLSLNQAQQTEMNSFLHGLSIARHRIASFYRGSFRHDGANDVWRPHSLSLREAAQRNGAQHDVRA